MVSGPSPPFLYILRGEDNRVCNKRSCEADQSTGKLTGLWFTLPKISTGRLSALLAQQLVVITYSMSDNSQVLPAAVVETVVVVLVLAAVAVVANGVKRNR